MIAQKKDQGQSLKNETDVIVITAISLLQCGYFQRELNVPNNPKSIDDCSINHEQLYQ